MTKLKTRIAPTPSGYLHQGNAFSFVITAVIAHLAGADILLRIDDLDKPRYRTKYADDIFRTLDFLQIEWQEGPRSTTELEKEWSQHQRMDLYEKLLDRLDEKKALFACKCSRKQIERLTEDGGYPGRCRGKELPLEDKNAAWRILTDQRSLILKQWSAAEQMDYLPAGLRDFVVKRKDGFPAYQAASVADDLHFGVNLIVRGLDLYDSSLAQLFIADVLGEKAFADSQFFHHPLITNADGSKLSKSAGAEALSKMREQPASGYYRQLSHWLLLEEEVHSLDELKMLAASRDILGRLRGMMVS